MTYSVQSQTGMALASLKANIDMVFSYLVNVVEHEYVRSNPDALLDYMNTKTRAIFGDKKLFGEHNLFSGVSVEGIHEAGRLGFPTVNIPLSWNVLQCKDGLEEGASYLAWTICQCTKGDRRFTYGPCSLYINHTKFRTESLDGSNVPLAELHLLLSLWDDKLIPNSNNKFKGWIFYVIPLEKVDSFVLFDFGCLNELSVSDDSISKQSCSSPSQYPDVTNSSEQRSIKSVSFSKKDSDDLKIDKKDKIWLESTAKSKISNNNNNIGYVLDDKSDTYDLLKQIESVITFESLIRSKLLEKEIIEMIRIKRVFCDIFSVKKKADEWKKNKQLIILLQDIKNLLC